MKSSRRNFIKASSLVSIGISSFPFGIYGNEPETEMFLSKIGVCTGITNSALLVSTGFSYLEEGVRNFLIPSEPENVFNDKMLILKNAGIPIEACNSFLPGELKCLGPQTNHDKILQFTETAFRRAQLAGIKTIVFGSSGSRNIPDGFSKVEAKKQFVDLCMKMVLIAEKYNIVISLEPLNRSECNFINSVAEGAEIVEVVNHKNFRLLADIYHMLVENEGPESLIKYGKYLYHIHIAEKKDRSAPGVHGDDFTAYFKALKRVGYKGRISIECRWVNLEAEAQKALQTLQGQIALC